MNSNKFRAKVVFDDAEKACIAEAYAGGLSFESCARKFGTTPHYTEKIINEIAPHLIRHQKTTREKRPTSHLIDEAIKTGLEVEKICRIFNVRRSYVMTRKNDLARSGELNAPIEKPCPKIDVIEERPFITPPTKARLMAGR